MAKIGIVYFSQTGVTEQLAKAIISGINSESNADITEIIEHKITGSEIVNGVFQNESLFEKLLTCDAIIFGSPTYMGNVAAQFKSFADKSADCWPEQLWADKIAAGFTSGVGLNGEQSCTLLSLFTLACQQGMLWVGIDQHAAGSKGINRMGSQVGVAAYAPEKLDEKDLNTAHYLGQRIIKILKKHQLG